mgnify:CR=1 FL=1
MASGRREYNGEDDEQPQQTYLQVFEGKKGKGTCGVE